MEVSSLGSGQVPDGIHHHDIKLIIRMIIIADLVSQYPEADELWPLVLARPGESEVRASASAARSIKDKFILGSAQSENRSPYCSILKYTQTGGCERRKRERYFHGAMTSPCGRNI